MKLSASSQSSGLKELNCHQFSEFVFLTYRVTKLYLQALGVHLFASYKPYELMVGLFSPYGVQFYCSIIIKLNSRLHLLYKPQPSCHCTCIQFHINICQICAVQIDNWVGSLQVLQFPLSIYHSCNCSITISLIPYKAFGCNSSNY